MIKVGDKIPAANFQELTDSGIDQVSTDSVFKGKKVVMFGIPGAFTPVCSDHHLPGYVNKAKQLADKGVDAIICMAVNDPFVMKTWGDQQKATGKVRLLADGNAELTKKMGLDLDASGFGMSTRCHRFSMVVENGTVTKLHVQDNPLEMSSAACEIILGEL